MTRTATALITFAVMTLSTLLCWGAWTFGTAHIDQTSVDHHSKEYVSTITTAPHPAMATIATTNTPTRITEDDPRWNCLTMGDHLCGPKYKVIDDTEYPSAWFKTIATNHPGYDPYRCLIAVDDTTEIVCQDGWVWGS